MQDSEKDYIDRNLVNLVSKIQVQDSLIVQLNNVLNEEETEHFNRRLQTGLHSNAALVFELVKILKTRTNAYQILINALKAVKQTPAAEILEGWKKQPQLMQYELC